MKQLLKVFSLWRLLKKIVFWTILLAFLLFTSYYTFLYWVVEYPKKLAREAAQSLTSKASEVAHNIGIKATGAAHDFGVKAKDMGGKVTDATKTLAEKAKEGLNKSFPPVPGRIYQIDKILPDRIKISRLGLSREISPTDLAGPIPEGCKDLFMQEDQTFLPLTGEE
jgi:hypothetical protein